MRNTILLNEFGTCQLCNNREIMAHLNYVETGAHSRLIYVETS